jgi:hypothetical protein
MIELKMHGHGKGHDSNVKDLEVLSEQLFLVEAKYDDFVNRESNPFFLLYLITSPLIYSPGVLQSVVSDASRREKTLLESAADAERKIARLTQVVL